MKKRNQIEKNLVVAPILNKLRNYQLSGDVIWYCVTDASDAKDIKAGQPDITVVINCCNGRIALLFIECKKPTGKKPSLDDLSFEQGLFFNEMEGKPMTLCVVMNNPSQLWPSIKKARNL